MDDLGGAIGWLLASLAFGGAPGAVGLYAGMRWATGRTLARGKFIALSVWVWAIGAALSVMMAWGLAPIIGSAAAAIAWWPAAFVATAGALLWQLRISARTAGAISLAIHGAILSCLVLVRFTMMLVAFAAAVLAGA